MSKHVYEINDESLQDPLLKWALENPEGMMKNIPKEVKVEIFNGRTKRQVEHVLLLIRNWQKDRPVQFANVRDYLLFGKTEEEDVPTELEMALAPTRT